MRPEDRDEASLWDMRRYARQCQELVAGLSLEDFLVDMVRQLAVERLIEVVGEAASRVSDEFRLRIPRSLGVR